MSNIMSNIKYSPTTFEEFIGKDNVIENLKVYIESSKIKNKNLDHCLIYGPPGTGKTTLSKIIANEICSSIKIVQGQDIKSKSDIISSICSLNDKDILLIDELHSIDSECIELLYSIMDEYKLNIKIGKEGNYKITTVSTPKITIIGATTNLGNIPSPLEDRFGIIFYLSLYDEKDIFKILKLYVKKINANINDNEIKKISVNSKGTPRIAKRLLERFHDFKLINNNIKIEEFFNKLNIDKGLNELDISYLKSLSKNTGTSLKSISQILNIDEKTIINKIEPYLIKNKIITKSSKGRMLTDKGMEIINKE